MKGSTTKGSTTWRLAASIGVLGCAHLLFLLVARRGDALPGAWWIGCLRTAREAAPAGLEFRQVFGVDAREPTRVKLQSLGPYELFVDDWKVGAGAGGTVDVFACEELPSGRHQVRVVVTHPEGVASLRLLVVNGTEPVLVSDGSWRVRDVTLQQGEPATLWSKPPLTFYRVP